MSIYLIVMLHPDCLWCFSMIGVEGGNDVPDAQISHDNCEEVSKANASGIRVSDLQKPEQSSLVDSKVSNAATKQIFLTNHLNIVEVL
ncbi:UNVERIFIED_CONTAM: hypothetical protein Slati_3357100 [Sesamum latifolium]|uniref:Uncharacterized protein n=1 Tax=Sesamum latifolium TaxID=2727402 RepID=A0AAW2UF64_9LAMI